MVRKKDADIGTNLFLKAPFRTALEFRDQCVHVNRSDSDIRDNQRSGFLSTMCKIIETLKKKPKLGVINDLPRHTR
jgi:hypothetical protein